MTRHPVSADDVADAVLALRNGQHPVTTLNVRHHLGRGSFTTISRHLEALGAKEPGRPGDAEAMPAQLQAVHAAFVQRAWHAVREHAGQQVKKATLPLERRIHELDLKLRAVREHRDRLEWESAQLERELDAARLEVQGLGAELAQARQDLAVERRVRQHHERKARHIHGQIGSPGVTPRH
jgi:predicted RNase H-like nuclease (RuvC/YqgF family)